MKKCLIVCWIGKFPKYFELWAKSCSYNDDYDFIVFTDQKYKSKYKNVKINSLTKFEIENLIKYKLNFNIDLSYSYKLCDFKPLYGIIFEDYLKDYTFWGHCDVDMVFGKISHFISEDLLNKYDKINENGHFVLYRNNNKINNIYKLPGSKFDYIEVLSNKEHYAFDEFEGINRICRINKIKSIVIKDFVDIDVKHSRYIDINDRNRKKQFYYYIKGRLYLCYIDNNIKYIEKMYLHFQKKNPEIKAYNYDKYIICREGIINVKCINEDLFKLYNLYNGVLYEKLETIKYFFKKLNNFFKCSHKEKIIWIKRKIPGR